MHPLHDYIAKQLGEKLKSRRVVVWYDERSEFVPFIEEVRGAANTRGQSTAVFVGEQSVQLAEYSGSMFELRAVVEPHVNGDTPEAVVVYLPGCLRDRRASVLTELEKAGTPWEPQLKKLARNVLLHKYTTGVVDEMLPQDRKVDYQDLSRAAAGQSGSEPPSILKGIFHELRGDDAVLADWIASSGRDEVISAKEATLELRKLIKARVGLELPADASLMKLRALTLRYVLANEFRSDLTCPAPSSLDAVPAPKTKDEETAVRDMARRLRVNYSQAYAELADRVEQELGLANAKLLPGALGSIDTFRFEERALLNYCGELIANGYHDDALKLVDEREQSFWLDRDVGRKAQWVACRRMAELSRVAAEVKAAVAKMGSDPESWLKSYTAQGGWYRLDQAQRQLETWISKVDEEPDERPLLVVQRAYEDVCQAMADGFSKALMKANWAMAGAMPQTAVWSEVVTEQPTPVAYFLVDAMRFEMGLDLAERLPKTSEVSVRPALAALPSITPIGMAALLPGASSSFAVVEQDGKLGAKIDDSFLPDLASRKKFAAARVPKLVDLALDELLSLTAAKLAKRLDGAQVVVVRSQEIDHAGEAGYTYQARQMMDTVIDNLGRAIGKLAVNGVAHAVITADHGHLFFPSDRDESMRTDSPGGKTVELHRRCWLGRGGTTPPGCVRVPATALGYASDLDFVFPTGCGVFRSGGDLAFHHGGPSLQELVIPVITVRTKARESARPSAGLVTVEKLPEVVTNRIFSVTISLGGKQMMLGATSMVVRPLLVAAGQQVGTVGMAVNAELDSATDCIRLEPGKVATIAFQLKDDKVDSLRVVVQEPATDGELYRSPHDIPVRLGV